MPVITVCKDREEASLLRRWFNELKSRVVPPEEA
jgi:hypothetical protein